MIRFENNIVDDRFIVVCERDGEDVGRLYYRHGIGNDLVGFAVEVNPDYQFQGVFQEICDAIMDLAQLHEGEGPPYGIVEEADDTLRCGNFILAVQVQPEVMGMLRQIITEYNERNA